MMEVVVQEIKYRCMYCATMRMFLCPIHFPQMVMVPMMFFTREAVAFSKFKTSKCLTAGVKSFLKNPISIQMMLPPDGTEHSKESRSHLMFSYIFCRWFATTILLLLSKEISL